MRVIFSGQIKQGKLKLHDYDRELFQRRIEELEGKPVELTMEKARTKHSDPSRRYYFGVVVATLSNATGHTPDEMHEILKLMFHWQEIEIVSKESGEIKLVRIPKTTTTMTQEEFSEYIEAIKRWAATDLHCYIPDAEQVLV